ncbi:MAG TPA: PmoA family protein [Methylomirabilota bacterium]|nr:PmoA family protein [Methylomirabilota bacterium]
MLLKIVKTVLPLAVSLFAGTLFGADSSGVRITEEPDKLRVEINGELFTEYRFQGAPHVYFHPLLGPGGRRMTRDWPMRETPGEERDHPHHRSLWYAHGDVNGVDFWAETPRSGKIVHEKFLEVKSGREVGVIRSANRWIAPNGDVTCTDERTFRVYNRPGGERLFDFEVTLKAGDRELVLGDTKEGSMAIRLNETMRLKHNKENAGQPPGSIVLSTGVRDGDAWGKRAEWCDYHGLVDGQRVGVAIFDHPKNPVYPTYWHVRDYGLFAANPFGVHDFEKKPKGTGNLVVPAGRSVTFRYRFYLHEGDEKQAKVAERYKEYQAGL